MFSAVNNLKKLLLLAGLVVFAGLPAWAAKGPYRFMAATLADSAKSKKKQRLVVAGFYTESGRTTRSCSIVASRLTAELAARPNLELIERGKAGGSQRAGSNGVLDAAAIKQIGTATGAQAAVTGTVIELGDGKIEVSARLVDAASGRILKSITTTIKKDWARKKGGPGNFDFDQEMDMDSLEEMLPDTPDEGDSCGVLNDEEASLVKRCVELLARKTAFDMRSGALDTRKLTRNPGSEIKDAGLKDLFYSRMKDWYSSGQLARLTAEEEELLSKTSPMIEKYPCR